MSTGSGSSQRCAESIIEDIGRIAESKTWERTSACTIYRVGTRKKRLNPKQYNYELISLGLYDRLNRDWESLQTKDDTARSRADMFRLSIVSAFLVDLGKSAKDWDDICKQVAENPTAMKELYRDVGDDLPDEDVASVLTLDAMFLACFMCSLHLPSFAAEFPSVMLTFNKESSSAISILREDIVNLENQIPLVLLQKVFTLVAMKCQKFDRREMVDSLFAAVISLVISESYHPCIPGFKSPSIISTSPINYAVNFDDRYHLLDCLYAAMTTPHPAALLEELASQGTDQSTPRTHWYSWLTLLFWPCHPRRVRSGTRRRASRVLPSVSQLVDAGIEFRGKPGKFGDVRFLQLRFKAILFLPLIETLGDDTERIWRNLVAYEDERTRTSEASEPLYDEFKAYLELMDELIDTENDVAMLKSGKHPVICKNGLGNDKAVAELFNTMLCEKLHEKPPTWAKLRKDIHTYYNDETRRARVEFMKTYFGKWWLTASLIAATFLLVLTVIQTIYAMFSYHYDPDGG